ncbi:MAG: hypothetical protein K2P58_01495 [Hyphomonadaceae bacterium]|nr:hypothetical protein [Hyphomonadaceae bacterium]
MTKALWHYPRTAFAEQVFSLLAGGPIQAVSLFGPRRTGKTQFLLQDLAPLAEARGHRVVYASLWQTIDYPLGILLYEFDVALREGSFLSRLKSAAGDIAPKFRLKAPFGAGEVEIDLANLKGKPPENHLLLLDQYCERLAGDDKPAFLLFDEFQELSRAKDSQPLIAALRTSLDKRKQGLVAVFTGSSQEGLRQMFTARQAPFFRFAQPIDLPALGEDFVAHQLRAFAASSKSKIDRQTALEVFARFDRNPLFFQRWLMTLALQPDMSSAEAIDAVRASIAEEFGFALKWVELNAVQRLTARMLAEGVRQLYGKEGGDFIEALTGAPAPSASSIQSALRRLSRLGYVDKWDDEWRFADPLFEAWVRERPRAEF